MKTHRIIQVSAYYPPHLGGQENAVYDLAGQLAAAGHEVQVLTSSQGGGARGGRREAGVLVRRLYGWVFGHAPIMPGFASALFRAIRPGTVVHLHIGQAFTPEMVWLVSKLRRFKYVAELHIDFEPSGPAGVLLPLYKRLILKRVLRAADTVVALNEKTLRIVREVYGCTGRARIMHNGLDDAYFAVGRPALKPKPPKMLRLLFVGRLSKQKNLITLLQALTMTKRKVHLEIIGEGEERGAVQRAIAVYKLKNVRLHGRQRRDAVMKFYKTCDALIMPSLYEAQPLVLHEAMAAGIPIIGTNVIGVEDHIKGVGIIVDPSAQGLAEGIERYYEQYSLLPEMIEKGYRIADGLRWRSTLKEYEGLYETVLGS